MAERTRVLFVVSDLAFDDDGVFAAYFADWLAERGDVDLTTCTWRTGPLAERCGRRGPVVDLDAVNEWRVPRALRLVGLARLGAHLKTRRLRSWLRRARPDVVVAGDAHAARALGFLATGPQVVVRVDDLDDPRPRPSGTLVPADLARIGARADLLLAGDRTAADRAAAALGLPPERVVVGRLPAGADRPAEGDPRAALGLPDDAVVVAAPATADPWADPDRFVLVAWGLRRRHPGVPWRFVWLTAGQDARAWPLHHDLRNAGLEGVATTTDEVLPLDLLRTLDVLVLPGRTPAVPRLWEEAVAAGCPVATFAHGDLAAWAAGGAGTAVPYLDVDALVDAVARLATDRAARDAAVAAARAAVARAESPPPGLAELLAPATRPTTASATGPGARGLG